MICYDRKWLYNCNILKGVPNILATTLLYILYIILGTPFNIIQYSSIDNIKSNHDASIPNEVATECTCSGHRNTYSLPPHLRLGGDEVHVVADRLLHGAFEGLVGGCDWQKEVIGVWLALREEPLIPPILPTSSHLLFPFRGGGIHGMEEGNGGWREEASTR